MHYLGGGMEATVVDMRYRMREVLEALDRREKVSVLFHGKVKGEIIPVGSPPGVKASSHPFFGSAPAAEEPVADVMVRLRGGRHAL